MCLGHERTLSKDIFVFGPATAIFGKQDWRILALMMNEWCPGGLTQSFPSESYDFFFFSCAYRDFVDLLRQ